MSTKLDLTRTPARLLGALGSGNGNPNLGSRTLWLRTLALRGLCTTAAGLAVPAVVAIGQVTPGARNTVTVVGCLTDTTARAPLGGIVISAHVADRSTDSDSTGFFVMHTTLPNGQTSLVVSPRRGLWQRTEIPVTVVGAGLIDAREVYLPTVSGDPRGGAANVGTEDRTRAADLLRRCREQVSMARRVGGLIRVSTPSEPPGTAAQQALFFGCYSVRQGSWSGRFAEHSEPLFRLPPQIRLDSARVAPNAGVPFRRLAPSLPRFAAESAAPPSWNVITPDSLELYWSAGAMGLHVAVGVRGDSLSGGARAFQQMHGATPTAAVHLRRVACS